MNMNSSLNHQSKTLRKMGCKINSFSPNISNIFTKTPKLLLTSFQTKQKSFPIVSSSLSQNQQEPITTTTQTQAPKTSIYNVNFITQNSCKLGISIFPDFVYNAEGGTGVGMGTKNETNGSNEVSINFDIQTLYIPPLNSKTTTFLGLPLPPFLKIEISPELFQGIIDEETGKVNLEFKAKFWFSVGSVYKAPPLIVWTVLTSEESLGTMRKGKGERLNKEGKCRLVGVATVQPIDDFFMNTFLGLPTECLADMNATITISSS
ncbi:hypothetical protein MKW98_011808 [Papaver atlanticum]|uniref:Uncharacterized protein n=1 Tax=Papaver atlanticum TaxID=357466 RepID=A0AAD4SNS5_9MAGN|nr:hypothetical protein MKW98_011808 [Papaver atlanticum]